MNTAGRAISTSKTFSSWCAEKARRERWRPGRPCDHIALSLLSFLDRQCGLQQIAGQL
jgi:hypothetical protein